jgi:hypothetical protein
MSIPTIDDLMKADLLYWRDLWFMWAAISTGVVVAGLFGELPELIHELRSMWSRYEVRGDTVSLREPHEADWIKPVAFVGWFLIVLGVAGELGTTVMLSRADVALEAFNNALLAETNREAGNAKESAKAAAWAARQANNEADEASNIASTAKSEAEAAIRDLRIVTEQADAFKKHLHEVDVKASSRMIDKDEFDKALKGRPVGWVEIWYVPFDVEAKTLANLIYDELLSNGWKVTWPIPIPEGKNAGVEPGWKGTASTLLPSEVIHEAILFGGLTIITSEASDPGETPYKALSLALRNGVVGETTFWQTGVGRPVLPPHQFVLVVGQRVNPPPSNKQPLSSKPSNNAATKP